jgi:D-glycero-D-manno-heptose 1,7-bisphosphate phosphatase
MILVAGRPYLEYVIASFAERGFHEFVLLTGHRAETIEQHFGDGTLLGVSITYSRETHPLGTGGALLQARTLLGHRFVVTYGDVLRRFDYDRFVRVHPGNCLAVYPRQTTGNTDVAEDRVIRFDKHAPELPYIDAGFSVIDTTALELIPPTGTPSFEETVFPALAAQDALAAEIVDLDFCDIGTPDELARTRAKLERA